MKKTFKQTTFAVVALALAIAGCNSFENPNTVTDSGTDTMQMDAGNSADVGNDSSSDNGPDIAQSTDASQDIAQSVDTQQVEVAQAVTQDSGPAPECKIDTDCNDNNVCTIDVCVVGAKCSHMAIEAKCDDGNACTDNDTCNDGQCKGTDKNCNDNNVCTDDFCQAGKCLHGVNSVGCDDGNACTSNDKCDAAKCTGTPVVCSDANPCTTDSCDASLGCVFYSVDCNDNNPCTTDSCDTATGNCQFSQKVCDDGKPYTYDFCDFDGWYGNPGQCVSEQKLGACTKDSDCEDGDACTIDVCNSINGTCKWVSKKCDDGDVCTTDTCVSGVGCVNNWIDCNDGDLCTDYDSCYGNGQCSGMKKNCNDYNANTADSCDKATGNCVHTPIVTTPPATTGNVTVSISCGSSVCEPHLYFGQQTGGTAFDVYGTAPANSSYVVDVPKSQLCVWGLEVASRLETTTWPWFGCDASAPSLNTLTVKVGGVQLSGALTKHPWVCQGGGEGNLAFTKAQLGCP